MHKHRLCLHYQTARPGMYPGEAPGAAHPSAYGQHPGTYAHQTPGGYVQQPPVQPYEAGVGGAVGI